MQLNCPECKNDVGLSSHSDLAVEQTVECDVCGISLLVTGIQAGVVSAEVADEGK